MLPKSANLFEPGFEIIESLALEAVDAETRVVVVTILRHETALAENAQVPAHRGSSRRQRIRKVARFARFFPQNIDDGATRGIGESRQRSIERFAIRHATSRP